MRIWLRKKGGLLVFFLLPGLVLIGVAKAQSSRKPLRVLTTKNGLPQSFISGLIQDTDGFVWVSTRNGLARYDGRQFLTFHYKQGDSTTLSSDVIMSLAHDTRGHIWIEHESGEMDILTPQTQRIERLNRRALYRQQPRPFARRGWTIDSKGRLWGTQLRGGIYCYDWENRSIRRYTRQHHGLPSDTVRGLLAGRQGSIWLLSQTRLTQLNPATGQNRSRTTPVSIQEGQLSELAAGVVTLHERLNGEIMWVVNQQLLVFSLKTNQFRHFSLPSPVGASLPWFYTGPSGQDFLAVGNRIYRYDPARGLIALGELDRSSQSAESMLVDRAGLIWVGTNAAGIQQIDISGPYFENHANQLGFQADLFQHAFGLSLARTVGWPATDSGFRLASYFLRSTYDSRKRLWIGLRDRVGYYDSTQRQLTLLPPIAVPGLGPYRYSGVAGLRFDSGGTLWISDDAGNLARFDVARQQWLPWMPANRLTQILGGDGKIADMLVDEQAFWLTTNLRGLIRIDRTTQRIQVIDLNTKSAHFPSNILLGLQPDLTHPDRMWIGSYAGLIRFDKTAFSGQTFTTADGLPDNTIYSIVADDAGFLWLSTNRGLCRFHPQTQQVQTVSSADGLPGDEFNRFHHLRLPDGRLAFGGPDGWTLFDPRTIQADRFQPPVALTELKINNRVVVPQPGAGPLSVPINRLEKLVLPYEQNTVSLSFAGLQYNQPAKLQYRYQLVGYDQTWVEAGFTPLATYTQLPPGQYTLRVNTTNTTGQWSQHIRALPIVVKPPWWRTNLAYFFYILSGMGLLWLYGRFRAQRAQERQEKQSRQREAEQLREVDEMKTRFFANITHEFRTPLTLILTPTETLLSELEQSRYRERLTLIERNARQLLSLINQLMDLARLDARLMKTNLVWGRPDEVVAGLIQLFAETASTKSIQLFYQAGEPRFYWFDAEKLERIVSNLLANALKFTPGTPEKPGMITITLQAGETFQLCITDTGMGIAADHLPHLFDRFYRVDSPPNQPSGTGIGLALVKELVDLQGGRIRVESEPGRGTTFWVELPYRAVLDEVLAEPLPAESTPVSEPSDQPLVETARLLLVEDHDEMAGFITQSLSATYQIHRAVNGREGLELARQLIPDLIISDVMMPLMDGYELCNRVKSDPRTDHIPVLLLTAKGAQESRMQGLQMGADEYLSKPFHLPELQLRLANLLTAQRRLRERLRAELAAPGEEPKPAPHPFLKTLYELLDQHLDEADFGVDQLADGANLSRMQLHRKLKALTGLSTTEFMRTYRLQRSVAFLTGGMPVTQTAFAVGFDNPSYFGQCFREQFGQPPSTYLPRAQQQ